MKPNKNQILVGLKGFAMGMADIVPGVSGGTVALITGVYDDLIQSISSVNKEFITKLFKFDVKGVLNHVNAPFIIPLFVGIILAIVSMSKVMHFFMTNYSIYTWSLFFGLILASIIYVGKTVENIFHPKSMVFVAIGTGVGYAIVSLVPVHTPETALMTFLSGCIAICAMILPGISGSFILLILGKYLFVTSALKNPFNIDAITTIMTFVMGCLVGLLSFSKVLNYLLKNFHNIMMCVLTGFMIGSLKKIWPWREVLESTIIRGKTKVLQDQVFFPSEFSAEVITAFVIMIIGFGLIFVIEKLGNKKSH